MEENKTAEEKHPPTNGAEKDRKTARRTEQFLQFLKFTGFSISAGVI